MGRRIGIDLGMTDSVMAVMGAEGRPIVLKNKEGKPLTPCMVSWRKRDGIEEFLIGEAAYDYCESDPQNTIHPVRCLTGRRFSDAHVEETRGQVQYDIVEPTDETEDSPRVILGGKEYSPTDILAMILRKLKEDAEFRLGEEVTHAVASVPAHFSQTQRDATRAAVLQAGLEVIRILDEPIAVALAYGIDSDYWGYPKSALVYGLDGDTFDASVLLVIDYVFAETSIEGDIWPGGSFDQVLVDYAVEHVRQEYGTDPASDRRAMIKLGKAARNAREALCVSRAANLISPQLILDYTGGFIALDLEVTRSQYEEMIRPLAQKTLNLAEKAIKNAGLINEDTGSPDLSQIDCVLMSGSVARIPVIQHMIVEMFGENKVMRTDNPEYVGALGAALFHQEDFLFCPNRDPDEPTKKCGYPNSPEATICARCGEILVPIPLPDSE